MTKKLTQLITQFSKLLGDWQTRSLELGKALVAIVKENPENGYAEIMRRNPNISTELLDWLHDIGTGRRPQESIAFFGTFLGQRAACLPAKVQARIFTQPQVIAVKAADGIRREMLMADELSKANIINLIDTRARKIRTSQEQAEFLRDRARPVPPRFEAIGEKVLIRKLYLSHSEWASLRDSIDAAFAKIEAAKRASLAPAMRANQIATRVTPRALGVTSQSAA